MCFGKGCGLGHLNEFNLLMWWTALAYGIRCAKLGVSFNNQAREPSTMKKASTLEICRTIGRASL
jgi:hypothetical protein